MKPVGTNHIERLSDVMADDETHAGFARAYKDLDYISRNYTDLESRHSSRWIAVLDEEVVGSSPTFDELIAVLNERGIDPAAPRVMHILPKGVALITRALVPND